MENDLISFLLNRTHIVTIRKEDNIFALPPYNYNLANILRGMHDKKFFGFEAISTKDDAVLKMLEPRKYQTPEEESADPDKQLRSRVKMDQNLIVDWLASKITPYEASQN